MNKIFNKITMVTAVGLSLTGMTACSDPSDPITSVEYNRLFSPTELEAKVQNTTGVKLTWFAVSYADAYNIEFYADDPEMTFSGTPVYTTTIAPDAIGPREEISWTLPAGTLQGETVYSVRMKGVSSTKESKWAGTTFETGTEQIFYDVPTSDITKTSVTLKWPAGTAVTKITAEKSSEVVVEHTLTADEIAAGEATIGDLKVESTYTFYIYNGEKQRGKMKVTTLPNFTPVTTAQELIDAIAAAEAGEVIMLTENKVYDFTALESPVSSITIDKDIVLNTNNGATIKGIYFQISNGASFEFANITIDGTDPTDGNQAFVYKGEGNFAKLYIHNAEIKNVTKGLLYIGSSEKSAIDDITIENCYIHDIVCQGGDFIDSRGGGWNSLTLQKSTIYKCAETTKRAIIRFDNNSNVQVTAKTTIQNCTFSKCGTGGGNSYGFLHLRYTGNSTIFKNNVVADFVEQRGFSDQKTTGVPEFANNFYYNTKNLLSKDAASEKTPAFFDTDGTEVTADPFKDAANGDFTIMNEKIADKGAGDPRWIAVN